LEFGTDIHIGFQAIYDPKTWDETTGEQKLKNAIDAFTASCEARRDRYLLATSQLRTTWDGRDDYAARVELGQHMLTYYMRHVHPIEDRKIRPVKVEQRFRIYIIDEFGNPVRCYNSPVCGQSHINGAPVVHGGQVDAIFQNLETGGYEIVDWKTVGGDKAVDGNEKNTSRFYRADLVWMHDQLSFYCFALRYIMNINVTGFILAEIRKGYPKVPTRMRRPRNGGIFSQDKNMETELAIYKAHVMEYDPEGYAKGAYDGFLEYLNGPEAPVFHKRHRVPKDEAELEQVGINTAREIKAMVSPDILPYPAPGPIACPRCTYRAPCEMQMHGMEYEITLNGLYEQIPVVEQRP